MMEQSPATSDDTSGRALEVPDLADDRPELLSECLADAYSLYCSHLERNSQR